ncbi:MAG: SpoIID/LytB domain-containing protein [Candidatus Omnitrophica bacterium]|nr:SpoIID/LytB domain-containing protein [Candidatus Omnitrophota bacterium]MDD5610893.1 SpoIID/LytB domain-containing protein [Candidatus Omnitrophota bacterium]
MRYRIPIIIGFLVLASLISGRTLAFKDNYVRIAIMKDVAAFDLSVSGAYQVVDTNNTVLARGSNLKTKIIMAPKGFYINSLNIEEIKATIKPRNPDSIRINDRRFRGDIMLIGKPSGILVINFLNLEDYLKGVLYHEISHYWPIEAIKAQAVVSRTFALYQSAENKNKEYDMTCDIYSQMYGGRTSERWRTSMAVDKTRGQVIKYQGAILPAYFHATCGGSTEDANVLWNIDLVPLKGVICNFCKKSPHYDWTTILTLDAIKSALNKSKYRVNIIRNIVIKERNKTNRINKIEIITDAKNIDISGKDFRNIIGPNVIKSLNFGLKIQDENVEFQGIGWGHGVGMCQWGAYFMARSGASYEEIIQYYYPGGVQIGYVN